jgi:hypothetical protein
MGGGTGRRILLVLAVALLAVGCQEELSTPQAGPSTSGEATGSATQPAAATLAPADPGALLPEGTYRTAEISRDQLVQAGVAAGFPRQDVVQFLDDVGAKEKAAFTLRLAHGGWTEYEAVDGAAAAVGWRGSYRVDDDDTVVAMSDCGEITYRYAVAGDDLSLEVVDHQCGGEGDRLAQTVIFQTAPFHRIADNQAASGSGAGATGSGSSFETTRFVLPFEVTLPAWLPSAPNAEESHFVTWDATDADRAVRVLAPVNVYAPGSSATSPVPSDYLAYLLSQAEHGGHFAGRLDTKIGGKPATILTATTDESLDGSIGCQEEGMAAGECFGLQPEMSLRLAVIDAGEQPVLIWLRSTAGVDATQAIADFDKMLATIQFASP